MRSSRSNPTNRPIERLKAARPDLVFNIAERLIGPNRESHIPVICEVLGLPYTGSDPMTLGICLDKSRAKEILSYHGVPNPEFWVVEPGAAVPADGPPPGHRQAALRRLEQGHQGQLRRRHPGRARGPRRRGHRDLQAAGHRRALPPRHASSPSASWATIRTTRSCPSSRSTTACSPDGARPIYSYEAKWIWDTPDKPLAIFKCPARIPAALAGKIDDVVRRACRILRIKDWCRIDVRLDENGEPNILEVNPLPGILPKPEDNSCLPKAARTAGYSYNDLILRVVDEALARYGSGLGARAGRPEPAMTTKSKNKHIVVGIAYNAYDPLTGPQGRAALGGVRRADGQGGPDRGHRARLLVLHHPPAQELHGLPATG